jgi:hypothetical protein
MALFCAFELIFVKLEHQDNIYIKEKNSFYFIVCFVCHRLNLYTSMEGSGLTYIWQVIIIQ